MSNLVQITTVHSRVDGIERGARPVFELQLEDHQQLVGVQNHWTVDRDSRKTVDHHANFWVATRL